jgi:predicted nuclease with TOPRIM domain
MGAIEDIRKVMQDFLAPELRAIEERLKNLETNLKDFRQGVDKQFEKVELKSEIRYKELVTALNLEARMQQLERERGTVRRAPGVGKK